MCPVSGLLVRERAGQIPSPLARSGRFPNDPFTSCDVEPGDSDGHAFVFSGAGLYAQGPANIWDLYILDVDGTRLISVILSYAKTPTADLAIAGDVIETLDIEP